MAGDTGADPADTIGALAEALIGHLAGGFFVTEESLERELERLREDAASRTPARAVTVVEPGVSREGRPIRAIRVGRGERRVSVVAGAHADEPVGPATALALARLLALDPRGAALHERFEFLICPQVNPDGAERNRAWFGDPPDALAYLAGAVREAPGEDVEFGYPRAAGAFVAEDDATVGTALGALRPENEAVARFLRGGAPFAFHASLHGMGFSEGAWFLIGEAWAERAGPLMERMARRVETAGWTWHDIDRRGEKGFRRIRRGFSTTPNHVAMRRFFREAGDEATAGKFHPSSMEFVRMLGGDPLTLVSELPLFLVGVAEQDGGPEGVAKRQERVREELARARVEMMRGEEGWAAARARMERLGVRAAPLRDQVRLQAIMVLEALEFLGKA